MKKSNWEEPIKRKRLIFPLGETIPEIFLKVCKEMKSRAACRDERAGELSYDDLQIRVILLADYIRKLPGKYIGILLPASVAVYVLILATELAGKIPLLINWTMGPRHLESVLELSKTQVVFTSKVFLERLPRVDLSCMQHLLVMLEDIREQLTFWDKFKAFWRSKQSVKSILKIFGIESMRKDDPAVLLFTSGTESIPKGVILSHNNVLTNHRDAVAVIPLFSDDVFLSFLPPFHAFGFTATGLFPILVGIRTIYYPDATDGRGIAKECEKWKVTLLCAAPTFFKRIFKLANRDQLKTLRVCIAGAERVSPELWDLFELMGKKEIVAESYGITECGPALTVNRPERAKKKGVGQALPSVEIIVVYPETFQPLQINEEGLILVRGDNVFSGYLNPDIESPFVEVMGKQWYKTGDMGYLDEDGYLTISGRLKRFIKIGPEMISLSAIEEVLQQAALQKGWVEQVSEGPILAVIAKDVMFGKPKVILVATFPITVEEVNRAIREAGFSNLVKVNSVIEVFEIPLLGTGKINYRALDL